MISIQLLNAILSENIDTCENLSSFLKKKEVDEDILDLIKEFQDSLAENNIKWIQKKNDIDYSHSKNEIDYSDNENDIDFKNHDNNLSDKEDDNNDHLIEDTATIVISPINKDLDSNSNTDFREQLDRRNNKEQMMWDDTKYNQQKKDGIFIFAKNRSKNIRGDVYIHKVEEVYPPDKRLKSWSKNVGQGNRNVLYLSSAYIHVKWDKWIEIGGSKKVQGTQPIVTNKNKIIKFINDSGIRF